eukprot:TRINITY_DN1316_c0_g1_i1.p1 TRINITY_DN1316_c0_g1~~TRINITY_DN1316_c0_g1_i1.p1  ORF type:complete len:272 (-),score=68.02 TRINITY_DN1316_c0_g1_i1:103-918(-)
MVLVKEFRVLLPMTVEEYRVGQLYSVAKTSAQQTNGGEGVEVLKNEPYSDPAKGDGQYTEKIYHLGASLPGWIRALIPASALKLEERAWNAYPYCKTLITSPFLGEKFTFTIESRHAEDAGTQENIHGLSDKELKDREVDVIDIGKDKVDKKDYKPEEDPTLVRIEKAGRGPLGEGWTKATKPIMCCYKLVTVEFKMFGFQTRVEKFMQEMERNIFLKFHRQVYCWMDEYFGWSMEDVRKFEDKVKLDLQKQLTKEGEGSSSSSSSTSETK